MKLRIEVAVGVADGDGLVMMNFREKIKAIWLGLKADFKHPEEHVENVRASCTRLKAMKLPNDGRAAYEPVDLATLSSQAPSQSMHGGLEPYLKDEKKMPSESELVEMSQKLDTVLKAATTCRAKMSHYRLAAYVQSLPKVEEKETA